MERNRSKPSKWWSKLDLDTRTMLMMLKGALAPTITIAIDAISHITTTIGYLSALMSVVAQGLMPRAKFLKIMFFNLTAVCVSASLCCLAVLCAVKAREHNTAPNASESARKGYSSDACAVAGIWLILMIWGANALRALKPMELQDPMVAFSIFASVTITRAGTFVTLAEGLEFVSRLLKGFMIGFAVATGVSLFIYPITSRGNMFHDIKGYASSIEAVLESQISYAQGSSVTGLLSGGLLRRARTAKSTRDRLDDDEADWQSKQKQPQLEMAKLNGLHSKMQADLFYSKDEIAWGKLTAKDLGDIEHLFRTLLLPLSGMSMLPEILESIVNNEVCEKGATEVGDPDEGELKQSEIQRVVETLHERLVSSSKLVQQGLHYFLLALELAKPKHLEKHKIPHAPSAVRDEESRGETLSALQPDFPARFEQELHRYYSRRKHLPQLLASLEAFAATEKHDVDTSPDGPSHIASDPDVRQEFFMILYMGHLQDDMLNAILQLVQFANSKITDGTMSRSRLIFPKQRSIRAWLSLSQDRKETHAPSQSRQSSNTNPSAIYHDQPSNRFPDPEHLPPDNFWERGSTVLRTISHLIKSDQCLFGFRVAAASFSVGILAFLHQTQDFFIRQRCIWAMIVIVIGMNPTSGQTMFGFVARIVATTISLVLSLIVWYIVDGKTAGVIVFLYLANVFEYYFYIKLPQYFGASVISIVTLNVIIGYELQVRKLGFPEATSNGQPYYPIYLFGPYKLAAVAAGCAISFFWVIFPYPITAKSQMRKLLGRSLYVLAKFYSCMHTTIELWFSDELGSLADSNSPAQKLQASRRKIFKEEMLLLTSLRAHSHFTTYEPPIGGKFPKATYDSIVSEIQRILTSMSLMAHTTQSLEALVVESDTSPETDNQWMSRLAEIALKSTDFNSHRITSLLCHLSAAITNGQPLPPYLSTPDSFPLARQLQKIDGELLSIRHIEDPAFSAFVSLEVLRSVISFSLRDLIEYVFLSIVVYIC
ncbi:unnamed protein product [Penicillium olsonii]|nr:unnamed protein product [Penicillium olsonii]